MTEEEHRLWALAIHEAGHAVMALDYGVPVYKVTIVDDGDGRAGHCLHQEVRQFKILNYGITMAGKWAEAWVNDRVPECGSDIENAGSILNSFVESGEWPCVVTEILAKKRAMDEHQQKRLEELRPKIETLAKELLIRQTMTGDEINELFNSPPKVADASPEKVISELKAGDPARKSYDGTQRVGNDVDPEYAGQPTAGYGVGP